MLNKVAVLIVAVVFMQLIYFLLKSSKERLKSGNTYFKGREYVRGCILLVLFVLLILFMLF